MVELEIDATGVGFAVGAIWRESGLHPRLVLFTGSDKVNQLPQGVVTVGKAWLVGRMQVLLQGQRLHLPRTVEAGQLTKELMDYEIHVNQHANAQFNARSGSHDDLVIGLGLSCGIDRSPTKVSSRSYLEPGGETLEDALRDRWVRRQDAGR